MTHWSIRRTGAREAQVAAIERATGLRGMAAVVDHALATTLAQYPEVQEVDMSDRPANVHEVEEGVYGIGVWSQRNGQYTAPLDAETKRLTGCLSEFSRKPIGRMELEHARREARKVFGYSKKSD